MMNYIIIYIISFLLSSGFSISDINSDNSISVIEKINSYLDTCLSGKVKSCIKNTNKSEFVRYSRKSDKNLLSWDELRETDVCFNNIDTILNHDSIFKLYNYDMFGEWETYLLEIVNKNYHQHLNHQPLTFGEDIDSLRQMKKVYDSTTIAWQTADTIAGYYIPKDLYDSYLHIHDLFIQSDIENFKNNKDEDYAKGVEHFGMGLRMRNAWKLGGSRLNVYFSNLGIRNHDLISSFILTFWYRKLNNKPLDLDNLIKEYQKYQKLN